MISSKFSLKRRILKCWIKLRLRWTSRSTGYETSDVREQITTSDCTEILIDMSAPRRDKEALTKCCSRAMDACYDATLLSARAMLANTDSLEAYIKARTRETDYTEAGRAVAAAAFLTSASMSCQIVNVPLSLSAIAQLVTTGSWPTMIAVANPGGLAFGALGFAILVVSNFKNSRRKADILRHQNCKYSPKLHKNLVELTVNEVIILLSRSCNVINETTLLVMCIYYLDQYRDDPDATQRYIQSIRNEDMLERWKLFLANQENKKKQKIETSEHAKKQGSADVKHARKQIPADKKLFPAQRQVSRYIKALTRDKEHELRACLSRLRNGDELDLPEIVNSSDEYSE